MQNFLKYWTTPPVFVGDAEKTRKAGLLIWLTLSITIFIPVAFIATFFQPISVFRISLGLFLLGIFQVLHFQILSGKIRYTGLMIIALVHISTTLLVASQGTIRSPYVSTYIYVIVIAGALYASRGIQRAMVLSVLTLAGLLLAENLKLLPLPNFSVTLAQWVSYTAVFGMVGTLSIYTSQVTREALQRSLAENAERRQTEEVLRRSESLFRAVVDKSSDGVIMLDQDRLIKYVSPSYEHVSGYLPEDLLGTPAGGYVHPDDQYLAADIFKQVIANPEKILTAEYRILHKQGHWIWTESILTNLLDDPEVQAIVLNRRNVTERKLAQDARRESEEKFAKVFQNAPVLISILDIVNETYIDINDEGLLISGYSRDEMLGRTPLEVGWLTPETRNRLPHELNTQNLLNGLELSYRKKDGSEMIGLVQGEIISLAGRDCLLTVTSDITRQKQAQNALKESQEQLQAVVQTAQDAIVTMNSKQEIAFWNKAAEDMFGYTASEMLGQSVQTVIPQKLHSVSEEGGSLRSKGTTMESLGLNKAGQEFPVEISYSDWETRAGRFVTAILRDISDRKQNESQLRAIASLSVALRSEPTTARILPVIIDQIVSLLKVDVISIELIEPETGDSVIQASYGLVDSLLDTRQPKDTGLNAIISQTLKPYFSSDLAHDSNVYFPERVGLNFHSAVGMPLMAEDILIGYLWIGQKNDLTTTDIQVFNVISDIAATAIHRSTLHEQALKLAEDLIQAYDSTLMGWAGALELRDQETEGHSRRVVKMTVRLAQSLGMGLVDLVHVRQGAILHDIGKMGIPDAILHKPGPLTEDEWQIMRKHPLFAFQLLSPIEHLRQALEIPYCHHEKWDGSGYPRGLVAQEIPLSARVFAAIDIWDALRFDRPYRKAWPEQKVQDYLRSLAGTHLDPKVVEAFLSLLNPNQSDAISPPE